MTPPMRPRSIDDTVYAQSHDHVVAGPLSDVVMGVAWPLRLFWPRFRSTGSPQTIPQKRHSNFNLTRLCRHKRVLLRLQHIAIANIGAGMG